MSEPIRDAWGSTAGERESDRRYVSPSWLDSFDREFYADFGYWPAGSPLAGTTPRNDKRRAAIQSLIDRGATEGEREAARAALHRLDTAYDQGEAERLMVDAQHEADYEDAAAHGEA